MNSKHTNPDNSESARCVSIEASRGEGKRKFPSPLNTGENSEDGFPPSPFTSPWRFWHSPWPCPAHPDSPQLVCVGLYQQGKLIGCSLMLPAATLGRCDIIQSASIVCLSAKQVALNLKSCFEHNEHCCNKPRCCYAREGQLFTALALFCQTKMKIRWNGPNRN